jgi:hypothetical protein
LQLVRGERVPLWGCFGGFAFQHEEEEGGGGGLFIGKLVTKLGDGAAQSGKQLVEFFRGFLQWWEHGATVLVGLNSFFSQNCFCKILYVISNSANTMQATTIHFVLVCAHHVSFQKYGAS